MEKTGVIRKIDKAAEWVNSIMVVEKPTGGLNICMDSRDLKTKQLKVNTINFQILKKLQVD